MPPMDDHPTSGLAVCRTAITHRRSPVASLPSAASPTWTSTSITFPKKTAGEVIPQGKTPVDALKDAFALGNVVSPHMDETRALRWAAIHFGECSRNEYGGNFRAAWREVLWPLVGAYQALTEDGVPVGIVNDHQLAHGELDGYRVLVLPKPNGLTHGQQLAVTAFRASGGTVIENDPAWPWSDPNAGDAAADAFRAALGGHLKAAPLRVTGGPTGRYAVAYHKNRTAGRSGDE